MFVCLFETPKTKSISWDSSTMCDWVFKSYIVIPGNNKYKNISDSCPPQILSLITQIESGYLFGNPGKFVIFLHFLFSLLHTNYNSNFMCVSAVDCSWSGTSHRRSRFTKYTHISLTIKIRFSLSQYSLKTYA